ncbi:MAG: thiamine-phosphate kinase [Saprospiraceae bacterium]|nr:thiamine-phosphate kinase [Saprospiraceae bacterium]MBK8668280.1 thiamine-phosphate kinase [Saprospiraceae bacterium]
MSNNTYPTFTDVNTLGEFGLIDDLTKDKTTCQETTIKSIGDDAAVIKNTGEVTVVSTDMLVEGIHFDLMYTPLKHLGYKAVVVNLSDIFAMNAVPTQITVSIAISNKYSLEAIRELYDGIYTACKMYHVDLIGGDTTSSPKGMIISVTAIGQARQDDIVYRNGAKKGNILCVTGDLGASYLGLQMLEREKQVYLAHPGVQPELENSQYLIERQLKPEAQAGAIEYFRKMKFKPTAMIDISDGLASELIHICRQSGTGAFIEEGKVPIHPDSERTALEFNLDPITCALHGGEDYELLFTIDEKDLESIRFMPEVFIIGEMTDPSEGITLHTTGGNIHPITAQGWNHFKEG